MSYGGLNASTMFDVSLHCGLLCTWLTMHLACGATPTAACHDDDLGNSVLAIIVSLQVNCMQV